MKTFLKIFILLFTLVNTAKAQNQATTIKTTKISDNLYEFRINTVNVYALIGNSGVLMIDAGYSRSTDLVKEELRKITDKKIQYIINTHYNGDHTGGNAVLGNGASIIAHQACRDILARDRNFPLAGLPAITFQDSVKIFFSGEDIALNYFPGHTSSDIIVHFKNSNIAFIGDLVFSDSFPVVQADGNVYSLEKSLSVLSNIFSTDTRIMVSHVREIKVNELRDYLDMVVNTQKLVLKAIQEGKNPEETKKSEVLKEWGKWNGTITTNSWIDNLYIVLDEGKELSACNVLQNTYEKSGIEAMIAKYKEITKLKKRKPFFIETRFNTWGYALVADQKLNDAIEIFKINVEQFPQSGNTYDSLAEAYMIAGNKELAIKNYEKSLELNPQNTNATEQLKALKH